VSGVYGQSFQVTGRLTDATDHSALIGVDVLLTSATDSNIKTGGVTDTGGRFSLSGLTSAGNYKLRADYLGYKSISRTITVTNTTTDLGEIAMTSASKELKGVTVNGVQERGRQIGDTSEYNANAYKTHPDATAEDLVTKMPGVTSDNNGVKVNGESVQQVYVDGKPFFGTDPTLALRNMPAEVIDKIQVFDKLSDQSQFTGFDDGNTQKTMNIITRGDKREGVFGKGYAGYGTDDTYIAGGNLNIFNGDQRISILGLSNNINQQNFSAQDVLGVTGGSGGNRGGSGGGRGAFGGGGAGGGAASNFFVGQQNGITTTNSFGLNYSDTWGKKIKVSGSYFFNSTDNTSNSIVDRTYYTNDLYHENDTAETRNYNHRFNLRFEYNIDSFNSIIFTPGVSFQQNNSSTSQSAYTDTITETRNSPLSSTRNYNAANNSGYSSSNNLLIQHKFKKPRRTISLNINNSINEKSGNGVYNSYNTYTQPIADTTAYDQHYTTYNNGYSISPNVTYTEPVGKKGQILASYNPSFSKNIADKETYDRDPATGNYTAFDDSLSNKFNNTYNTQKGGIGYRVSDRKLMFTAGANVQYAELNGEQTYPFIYPVSKTFTSVLPNAMFNYRFADGRNLRIIYRTSTTAPSISQLQDVVDISNPLLLKTGNANLKQDYEHTLIMRYGLTKSKTSHNFFFNLYANYDNNYIANRTVNGNGLSFDDGVHSILIPKGSQLTIPVNLNGYFNERAFLTYSIPLEFMKSNLNLSGGFNFTRTPGMIDQVTNYANNYIPSGGLVISSNISQKVDFTLAYYANYNVVNNSVQTQGNTDYYSHTASFKFNWIFLKNVVFNTNITDNYYTAFSSTGNQDYILWNAYIAYKLLKKQALEARISVFDLLNQNKSISRTVTETYIENDVTQVLKQYFMFQLTYTIRNFKGAAPAELDAKPEHNFMRPPGGGPGGFPPGGFHGGGDDH